MNPYLVLNVDPGSGDDAIRAAYLARVKASPPDTAPREFQAIQQAYEKIKNEGARHRYILSLDTPAAESPVEALIGYARLRPNRAPLPWNAMKQYLQACTKLR